MLRKLRLVDQVLITRICTMTCNRRFSMRILKRLSMFLIGYLLTVAYFRITELNVKRATETLVNNSIPTPITNTPVLIKYGNTTVKYYPDHKAHDYPLSVLPDPYIISNADACINMPELKYIVIVISASNNFQRRTNIRKTWGKTSYYKQGEVKVVFILGNPKIQLYQKVIEGESRKYQDIVQGKFLDTYKNLTHKSVLSIRWVNEYCLNSKMVVKVDDDVVVNFFLLFNMMSSGECCHNPMEIMCHRRPMGESNIFRNGSDKKWIIDDDYFPNLKTYPFPYCDGLFTLIPPGVIPILYETAKRMPYFWIEDVFLTGILVSQLNQIQLTNVEGVLPFDYESKYCFENDGAECVFIAGISKNVKYSRYIWSFVLKYYHEDLAQ